MFYHQQDHSLKFSPIRSSDELLLLPPLLGKNLPGNSKNSLEALAALGGVLAKAIHADLLDAVLDLLPAAAERDDLGRLVEIGLAGVVAGGVSHGLLHGQQLAPGQVLRAHGDGLFLRVDVGDFVDEASFVGAEERFEPVGQGLLAGDQALGTKL